MPWLWAAPGIAPVVAVVAMVAMAATWIGNALRIGPPGAYMFALACAAATAMPADHLTPVDAGCWWAAAGCSPGWCTVADYLAGIGTPGESAARQQAAFVLQNAWSVLVDQQPGQARSSATLGRLRTVNRGLHLCRMCWRPRCRESSSAWRGRPRPWQVQCRRLSSSRPARRVAQGSAPLGGTGARRQPRRYQHSTCAGSNGVTSIPSSE